MKFDSETTKLIEQTMEDLLKSRGQVNILIAGSTGVGKSTLINAVFDGKIATTGTGKPITEGIKKMTKEGIPVAIYDTRGFEHINFKKIADEQVEFVRKQNKSDDWRDHIHAIWLCFPSGVPRVQESEQAWVKKMSRYVPCVAVITRAQSEEDDGYRAQVKELVPEVEHVMRVMSEPEIIKVAGQSITIPAHGLRELVQLTLDLVPEEARDAFAAAQKVDLKAKLKRARQAVQGAAVTAAGAAAVPLPMSSALALAPIQVGMFFSISRTFGLHFAVQDLAAIFGAAVGVTGATVVGRMVATELLKVLAPGPGSGAAAAINGTVAYALTLVIGEAFCAALYALCSVFNESKPSADEVIERFKAELTSDAAKRRFQHALSGKTDSSGASATSGETVHS